MPSFVYEDDQCVVYDEEANPQSVVHFVVVPKTAVTILTETSEQDEIILGRLLLAAKSVACKKGLDASGYHVIVDEDYKNHRLKALHVFGRALHHMLWPVGPGARL